MRNLILLFLVTIASFQIQAQFGYGFTITNNLYERFTNPGTDDAYKSSGSAILNLGAGPKIWIGVNSFSVSAEASANWSIFSLALNDYKGLGAASFPMIVNFNFKGLSGFDNEARQGFSIGGGIQYSRTELYGLRGEFKRNGTERKYFPTYVINAGYGFGLQGFGLTAIARYGFHPDNDAKTLSLGLQYDFNLPKLKKIKNKASEL